MWPATHKPCIGYGVVRRAELALDDERAVVEHSGDAEYLHALRFTAPETRKAFVWPARHYASSLTGAKYPPMGQRFRLKAGFDISKFSPQTQVILPALKRYGMMLADNGSSWYISGAPDPRWDNDVLHELSQVYGSDFEAVKVSSLMINPNSGATKSQTHAGSTAVQSSASGQQPVDEAVQF
jgi:hypothetical protein